MPTVLIAGGSGLVGSRLSELLKKEGYRVLHLSRRADHQAPIPTYQWDLRAGTLEEEALTQADYLINLAGAGIADRPWTKARKQLIIDSRVKSNALLQTALARLEHKPKAYLSASAVGYYGNTGNELVDENSQPGKGFLTESVLEWEKSIDGIRQLGIPCTVFRIGIVLSSKGGAFQKMFPSYHLYTGAYFGKGDQYYSWIHIDDLCRMFLWALQEQRPGIYNAVGPHPDTLKTIAQTIARAMDRKALLLPLPAPALRLFMGEMADMLLFSTRVSSQKIEKEGFYFQFPELEPAIRDVLRKNI